jgi:hypothetical protein
MILQKPDGKIFKHGPKVGLALLAMLVGSAALERSLMSGQGHPRNGAPGPARHQCPLLLGTDAPLASRSRLAG